MRVVSFIDEIESGRAAVFAGAFFEIFKRPDTKA